MLSSAKAPARRLAHRVAGQGALLTSGFALAQIFSLARNALIGHWLSPSNFGIAATLTMMLQVVETLSDLGADRLIVQAKDGNRPRLMANAHLLLIGRGALTALALYLAAGPIVTFFAIDGAKAAFQAMAIAPLLRGFFHLDCRRAQRRLDNQPTMLIEVVPQAVTLLLAFPIIRLAGDYWAIVWLALAQSVCAVLISHLVAHRPYAVAADTPTLLRLLSFGWPILLSALPLMAVFSGDRMIIGKLFGMEALASYSVAFMMTMVPGLLAAKVANALMLPLLASAQGHNHVFGYRFTVLTEVTVLAAALYLALFVIAGGKILPLAFGDHYRDLDQLVGCLAVLWAVRMVQSVPGMALIARGTTRPLLTAGIIRASALVLAFGAAIGGWGVIGTAAAGVAGELATLAYITWRVEHIRPGLAMIFLGRVAMLAVAALAAFAAAGALPPGTGVVTAVAAALVVTGCMLGAAVLALPGLKTLLQSMHTRSLQPTGGLA